jgi:hypothetical protein
MITWPTLPDIGQFDIFGKIYAAIKLIFDTIGYIYAELLNIPDYIISFVFSIYEIMNFTVYAIMNWFNSPSDGMIFIILNPFIEFYDLTGDIYACIMTIIPAVTFFGLNATWMLLITMSIGAVIGLRVYQLFPVIGKGGTG